MPMTDSQSFQPEFLRTAPFLAVVVRYCRRQP
jgi:hypothetical protein